MAKNCFFLGPCLFLSESHNRLPLVSCLSEMCSLTPTPPLGCPHLPRSWGRDRGGALWVVGGAQGSWEFQF